MLLKELDELWDAAEAAEAATEIAIRDIPIHQSSAEGPAWDALAAAGETIAAYAKILGNDLTVGHNYRAAAKIRNLLADAETALNAIRYSH